MQIPPNCTFKPERSLSLAVQTAPVSQPSSRPDSDLTASSEQTITAELLMRGHSQDTGLIILTDLCRFYQMISINTANIAAWGGICIKLC